MYDPHEYYIVSKPYFTNLINPTDQKHKKV